MARVISLHPHVDDEIIADDEMNDCFLDSNKKCTLARSLSKENFVEVHTSPGGE
jgi:hypothetical protein